MKGTRRDGGERFVSTNGTAVASGVVRRDGDALPTRFGGDRR